jgi:hypothetical protein
VSGSIIEGLDGLTVSPEGMISGKLASGPPGLGVLEVGRSATEANLRLAGRFYAEGNADDFGWLETPDGRAYWVDRASGRLYEERRSDPLLTEKPMEQDVSLFLIWSGQIRFLVPPSSGPTTVVELQEAAAATERAREDEAAAVVKFRAAQPQVPLGYADLPAGAADVRLTLRAAAARVEAFGGKIEHGRYGLRITVPARLTPGNDYPSTGQIERLERGEAALAALTLVRAETLVLEAVEDLAAARKPKSTSLAERLPDMAPALGSLV